MGTRHGGDPGDRCARPAGGAEAALRVRQIAAASLRSAGTPRARCRDSPTAPRHSRTRPFPMVRYPGPPSESKFNPDDNDACRPHGSGRLVHAVRAVRGRALPVVALRRRCPRPNGARHDSGVLRPGPGRDGSGRSRRLPVLRQLRSTVGGQPGSTSRSGKRQQSRLSRSPVTSTNFSPMHRRRCVGR